MIRSQPTYFQTPSDIASTNHRPGSFSANGTKKAAPEPTGGFLACASVSVLGGAPAAASTTALSPHDVAGDFVVGNAKADERGEYRLRVCSHGCISLLKQIDPGLGFGQFSRRKPQGGFGGDLAGEPSGPFTTGTAPLPVCEET